MLVDDLSYSFLEGGFTQDILKGAFDESSVKEADEFVCFEPDSVFSSGVFIHPLEERTYSPGTLEESPGVFLCVGHAHGQRYAAVTAHLVCG